MLCDSCDALVINGLLCHEFGCPNITYNNECDNCGVLFKTSNKNYSICSESCAEDMGVAFSF